MKTKSILCLMAFLSVCTLFSCKKDHDNGGLSDDIKNFVPQYIIDSMKSRGLTINEGKTPPTINGIYVFSPNYCIFDNSGYNRQGTTFDSYKYWFYNQDNSALTIKLNYKDLGPNSDTASGAGAFLSGSGNFFTAFINVNGVGTGISYSRIDFYSGEVTSTGINHFQTAFYMKSKSADPSNKLVAVGSSRIFNDQDDVSETADTYRIVNGNEEGISMVSSR